METRIGETFRKRLIVFYIPLFMFLVATLFPFYWMLITSLKPDPELYNTRNVPFWVMKPVVSHWVYLFKQTLFSRWARIRCGLPPPRRSSRCLPGCWPGMRCHGCAFQARRRLVFRFL